MNYRFESHGRTYAFDAFGCIVQTDARPFKYDEKYSAIYNQPQYADKSKQLQALRMGFVIGSHGQKVDHLMDFGYGNGAFLNYTRESKAVRQLYGYDVTPYPVEGITIIHNPLSVKVDVITMWDVIEHIEDLSFLHQLRARTLVISTPNCQMLDYGKDWFDLVYPHRKPDEHVRHFNKESLSMTMAAHGWLPVTTSNHENIIRRRDNPGGMDNILSMAFSRY